MTTVEQIRNALLGILVGTEVELQVGSSRERVSGELVRVEADRVVVKTDAGEEIVDLDLVIDVSEVISSEGPL